MNNHKFYKVTTEKHNYNQNYKSKRPSDQPESHEHQRGRSEYPSDFGDCIIRVVKISQQPAHSTCYGILNTAAATLNVSRSVRSIIGEIK